MSCPAAVFALYVHIPFCARKCAYCDFASRATSRDDPIMDAYTHAMYSQLRELSNLGLLKDLSTAYLGGGTPSLLGTTTLCALVETIARYADFSEFSVEANPESLSEDMPSALEAAGATRLSLGVQSLNDNELDVLGRVHSAKRALEALSHVKKTTLVLSADLMCGIPLQSSKSFHESLRGVIASGVDHLSIYPLILEEGTALFRSYEEGTLEVPDDDETASLMELALEVLEANGFERYEVASYATQGHICAHNCAYWSGKEYLGLGHRAASMLYRPSYEALMSVAPQLPALPDDAFRIRLVMEDSPASMVEHPALAAQSCACEFLTERQALAEDLMLTARRACPLPHDLRARAKQVMGRALDACLAELQSRKLLDEQYAPTRTGWLLGNELYGKLWELSGDQDIAYAHTSRLET